MVWCGGHTYPKAVVQLFERVARYQKVASGSCSQHEGEVHSHYSSQQYTPPVLCLHGGGIAIHYSQAQWQANTTT
jgi:hypothetical protein